MEEGYKVVPTESVGIDKAYTKFYNAANPMNTFTSKVDITRLVKRKKKHKLNAMILFCIQNAGMRVPNCHYDFNDENTIKIFDKVFVNLTMYGSDNHIHYVHIPYSENFEDFVKEYNERYQKAYTENVNVIVTDQALIATSAITQSTIESFASGWTDGFLKPFLVWGKYEKVGRKYYINISFRFHHGLYHAKEIAEFFCYLSEEIKNFKH